MNDDFLRDAATETLRSLMGEIRLVPENGVLAIELVGELDTSKDLAVFGIS